MEARPIQTPIENNSWSLYNASPAALVFVHGITSSASDCWTHVGRDGNRVVWPDLIIGDLRIRTPSIFMGGYYTSANVGDYGIGACADELFSAMKRQTVGREPVLNRTSLIFVCHSMGGIVVRRMLFQKAGAFSGKKVGLLLIGSPSAGSMLANLLKPFSWLLRHSQAKSLASTDASLHDLDDQFKDLVHNKKDFELVGAEAFEHRPLRFVPTRVVLKMSAGRYFGAPRLLRNTDHSSCVKPDTTGHPAYEFMFDFIADRFPELTVSEDEQILSTLSNCAKDVLMKISSRQITGDFDPTYDYVRPRREQARRFDGWSSDDVAAALGQLAVAQLIVEDSNETFIHFDLTDLGRAAAARLQAASINRVIGGRGRSFIFISDSKLEMLFEQYDGGEIGTSIAPVNRFKRLTLVAEMLRRTGRVGSTHRPGEFFHGVTEMRWGPYGALSLEGSAAFPAIEPLVYFGGREDRTEIALCGSTKHLLGFDFGVEPSLRTGSYSVTPTIEHWLRKQLNLEVSSELDMQYVENAKGGIRDDVATLHHSVLRVNDGMAGVPVRLEYLAITLRIIEPLPNPPPSVPDPNRRVLLGSPLYVALVPPTALGVAVPVDHVPSDG